MSRLGRELDYRHWDKDTLVASLMQAEDDIKELKADLAAVQDERDKYRRLSRESVEVLNGILRVLRDHGYTDSDWPVAPRHRLVRETSLGGVCACGNQWLPVAGRCVTQAVGS